MQNGTVALALRLWTCHWRLTRYMEPGDTSKWKAANLARMTLLGGRAGGYRRHLGRFAAWDSSANPQAEKVSADVIKLFYAIRQARRPPLDTNRS